MRKEYKYKAMTHSEVVDDETEKNPVTGETLAKNINRNFWCRRKVFDGTKGQ